MKTKKLLSLLLAMTMIFSMMSFPANAAEGHCDDEANCLVCNVADLINALPAAKDITVDNAATVTNQIHAIDRIKVDLTDDEYTELLALVDTGADESGQGLDVPVRYMEAVEAIVELDAGNSLYITKSFLSGDETVDVADATVEFEITNVATNAVQTVTLSTMDYIPNSLSANADFYSMNDDGNGWTYKFILPEGEYRIAEVSDSGATVNGEEFVTGSVSYDGELTDGITVTLAEGGKHTIITNTNYYTYNIDAVDSEGNKVSGVGMSIVYSGDSEETFSKEWTTDGAAAEYSFPSNYEYTLTVKSVPEGYIMPDTTAVTFTSGTTEFTAPFSYDADTMALNVTLGKEEVVETHSHPVCGATCAGDHDGTYGSNDGHTENVTYTALSSALTLDDTTGTYSGSLTTAGSYYLDTDITLSSALTISADVNLCLNGHKLTVNTGRVITHNSGVFNLSDCNGDNGSWKFGEEKFYDEDNKCFITVWKLDETGTHQVTGGIITGGYADETTYSYEADGGAIYSKSELNIYGGTIAGNHAWDDGGGIYSRSTLNMYGGAVSGNGCIESYGGGIHVYNSTFNMYSGEISYNSTCSYGGGVCIYWSNAIMNMYGGTIKDNKSCLGGAGINGDYATIKMYGGTISGNVSNYLGGGILASCSTSSGSLYMYDGSITGNSVVKTDVHSLDGGGGIAVFGTAYLYGGKITNNISPQRGAGIYAYRFNGGSTTLCSSTTPLTVTGNTDDSGNDSNFYIRDYNLIIEDDTTLHDETLIGVKNEGQFTEGGADLINHFMSDKDNAIVEETEDGNSLQIRVLNTNEYTIEAAENIENGAVSVDKTTGYENDKVTVTATADENYVIDTVTVTKADGSTVDVTVDAEDETKFTFTMPADNVTVSATFKEKTYAVNISSSFVGGTVTADVTEAKLGDVVTLTATPVGGYEFTSITVTDAEGNVIPEKVAEVALLAENESTNYAFEMPASDVTVDAVFTKKTIENVYTVNAVVDETVTTDKRNTTDGMDVYAGDTVKVDVVVNGADYTNADWTLVYDYSKFAFDHYEVNTAYGDTGYITHDETNADKGVIIGYARGFAGETAGDEFADGEYIVSYYFTAIPQLIEVTGKFNITSAHVNNYEMAGIQDNTAATSGEVDVTIILITDDDGDDTKTPAGSIEAAEKEYNALEQSGNEYVLDTEFEEATVTYAANADGSAVVDDDGDGDLTDAIAALTYKTGLPTWTNVGTYTYYVKVSGDGLATIYDSAVLTINPKEVTTTAEFKVDPDINEAVITPVIKGVVDKTYTGTVTVTVTVSETGDVIGTKTYDNAKSQFKYDGESSAVATESLTITNLPTSGTITATVEYTAGAADNYTNGEGAASIDVDKIALDDTSALEDAIESVFVYDSTDHYVVIDQDALDAITTGTWTASTPVDAYDETITDPSVTNVGDEKLVKVVFTDTTGVYNEVVVYVVLKVTPAKVTITVTDKSKAVGDEDPVFTYKVEIYDNDGNFVQTGLYGEDETAMAIEPERTPGETAGTYTITASYVPNANYEVEVIDGTLTIGAPSTDGPDADVKIEVVDLSKGGTSTGDETPDYIADKRLVLVYTNLDKVYYGYGDATNYEKMFDVTAAGYNYVDNNYDAMTFTDDTTEYTHVYGIVVDKIEDYNNTEAHEKKYRDNVIFLGSDAEDAPENIVYDADINLTKELDVNDYSMNNGIYNVAYDRVSYIKSILKADYDHDKVVDTTDSRAVKDIVDTAKVVTE